MKRLLLALCLLAAPLAAQPSRYSLATQVQPGFASTALGDTYCAVNPTTFGRIVGNTTTTRQFSISLGTGSVSACPVWGVLVSGDIPNNAADTTGTATKVMVQSDETTVAAMFPVWVTGSTGSLPIKTTSTKLSFRPDTGIFTATGFAGPLTTSGTGGQTIQAISTDTTTASLAQVVAWAENAHASFVSHSSARTATRYGLTLGGWSEFTLFQGAAIPAGLVIGTNVAIPLVFGTNNAERIRIDSGGNVGIGTTAPGTALEVGGTTHNYITLSSSGANSQLGFGYSIGGSAKASVSWEDGSRGNTLILNAHNSGYGGVVQFQSASVPTMTILTNSSVLIGTTSVGTSAAGVLGLGNGTAPSTSPANMIQMWAEDVTASSELRVRDEAGNVTTLSPHNFSLFAPDASQIIPWSYYSKNAFLGKEVNVDIYGAVAAIEKLTGKTFIYSRDLPSGDIEDWTAQEAVKKTTVEKQRLDKALAVEIEVAAKDAVEIVTITMRQPSATLTETVTKYVLDATTGKVNAETVTTPKMETIDTPKTETRLQAGVRLDEKTGRFWRKTTATEADVEPYVPKAPPAWIKERMAKK